MFKQLIYTIIPALLAAVVNASSTGCSSTTPNGLSPGGSPQNLSLTINGRDGSVTWTYLIQLPGTYQAGSPSPLHLSFHGANRDALEQWNLTDFQDMNRVGAIMVYPQANIWGRKNERYWLTNPNVNASIRPNDMDFVYALVQTVRGMLCVDDTRIYASGKSNGGGFTDAIACNATLSPLFAAFASVSGAYYEVGSNPAIGICDPTGGGITGVVHTPFLEFHGLDDCTAPYEGNGKCDSTYPEGDCELGVPHFLKKWKTINGCVATYKPTFTRLSDGDTTQVQYDCLQKSGIITHYKENNLGHCWPSTYCNDDCIHIKSQCSVPYHYNASLMINSFFWQYTVSDRTSKDAVKLEL